VGVCGMEADAAARELGVAAVEQRLKGVGQLPEEERERRLGIIREWGQCVDRSTESVSKRGA